jgi:L-histidine Nalpha-methyltransferase / hercynylcysteine S-oxide synthase
MTVENLVHSNGTSVGPTTKLTKSSSASIPTIIDIRSDSNGFNLLEDIHQGLRPVDGGEKTLPTLLLYDEAGLRLFEDITYLEEYYLTGAEIQVLERYAESIAERIQPQSVMVELGSGYGRPRSESCRA